MPIHAPPSIPTPRHSHGHSAQPMLANPSTTSMPMMQHSHTSYLKGSIAKRAVARAANRAASRVALYETQIFRPPATPIGLRVLLGDQPVGGAIIMSVDAHGLAWRAKLRAGDAIQSVESNGLKTVMNNGHELTAVAPKLNGFVTLSLLRRPWSRSDHMASIIQATWAGHLARATIRQQLNIEVATNGASCSTSTSSCSSPICSPRAPPRLSVGDLDDEDDDGA